MNTLKMTSFSIFLFGSILLMGCDQAPTEATKKATKTVTTLRFGHDLVEDSSQHSAAIKFAEMVKQRSNGLLNITIHPNQSLGNDRKMLQMAKEGELDIILPPTAKLSHIIPELQIVDFPFIFPSALIAHNVLDGKVGKTLLAKFNEHDLVGVAFWESGFKQLTSNKLMTTVEDFKGSKFRIMQSDVLRDQFNSWGADTITIDFGKTYDALKDGVADGQENPLNSIIVMKFDQVQKYLYLSDHGYLAQVLAFSQKTFNKLSKNHQNILMEVGQEITGFQREESQKRHISLVGLLASKDIQVSRFSAETRNTLQKLSRNVLEKHRMRLGTGLIEQVLQTIDADKITQEDELVIGIDADMSGNSAYSGLAIKRGIELALDEVNEKGGVLGKKLVIRARDNSMIPARGLANLKTFSAIPNLVAVFSGISSPVVLAELDYIHQNKMLFLDPWAAATPIIDNGFDPNYVFRVSVRDADAADYMINKALLLSNKVGLLLVDNPWGKSNHKGAIAAMKKRNLNLTNVQWFEWGQDDFSSAINNLYKSGVEVIVLVGNPIEVSKIIKQISVKDKPLAMISHWGITGGTFFDIVGEETLKKVHLNVLQTFSFVGNTNKQVQALMKRYNKKYFTSKVEDIVAPVGTAHAYDLTHLLVMAIKKAQSAEPEKIRAALESIQSHSGIVRDYNPPFTPDDHDALDQSDFIMTKYRNGYLVPIKP